MSAGERKLTLCAVPEVRGRIVTTPDGRLLRRVGSDAQPLRGDALARFVSERRHRAGEDEPLVTMQVSAFDRDAVNRVLTADGRAAVGAERMVRALADLGVAVAASAPLEPSVLRAAILFASDPRDFLRGAAVQLVRRSGVGPGPGPGPSSAREECAGPLAETVDCCLRFVDVEDQVWLTLLGQDDLTADERRTLVAVRRNGTVTPRELRRILPDADARALLAGAVAKGLAGPAAGPAAGPHGPPRRVHDSPREADLGLGIYRRLFRFVRHLEDVGPQPLFQYIVTTTTSPPDDLRTKPWLAEIIGGSTGERLLKRDL